MQSLAEQNIMRGLANVIQTTSGDRKIPVVSTHGSAGWLDEGKPTGIFNKTGGGQQAVTTAKATDITADELIDLHYGLRAPYRKNAVWLMHDATVKTVRKLKDGNGQYLWQPALTAGAPDLLLGRPVHTSTFVPEVKSGAASVAFGDLSYYWIADRQGRSFKRLNELFATSRQVGFLASQRLDGKIVLPEAVKILTQKATV